MYPFLYLAKQTELAEANRLADQRIISAQALQLDLQKLRPRVCRLVATLAGPATPTFGLEDFGQDAVEVGGGGGSWAGPGGYGGGSNGGGGDGGGDDEPETYSATLRRLAEGRATRTLPPSLVESGRRSALTLAAHAHHYALLARDMADDGFPGARGLSVGGGGSAGLGAKGRDAELGASAVGAGAASAGQEGLRASLDELCNLHDELGSMRRLSGDQVGGADNINRFMASIQMRRADAEARLELAAAAMSNAAESGAAASNAADAHAAGLAIDRAAARRMRIGEPYIPKTRRVVAAASPSAEEGEAGDGTSRAPAAAAPPSAPSTAGTARLTRNPYARAGADLYIPRPPRRQMRDEEDLGRSSAAGGGWNPRWERQPHEYIPVARRRHLAAEELARQHSTAAAPRSTRAAAAAAAVAAAAAAAATTSAAGSAAPADGGAQSAGPATAPAAALYFPPSFHTRSGGGSGQPPSIPPSRLPPVFPGGASLPPGSGGRRARPTNRRGSRVEEAERILRGGNDGDSDSFFSSLPPPAPAPVQHRGRAGGAAGSAAALGANVVSTSAAAGGGGGPSATGSPTADPDSTAEGRASEFPPELPDLVDLYCGRCQDVSVRLRAAVADREALSASTLVYLRGGRGGDVGAGSGRGGRGGTRAASMSAAAATTAGAFGWKTLKSSAVWGGDGGQAGETGAARHPCCAKCTEEVRSYF